MCGIKNRNLHIRQSNWELLRIISMLAIVAGHFLGQSGAYDVLGGTDLYIALFLGSASRVAVSLFLMLGVWFLVDSSFKAERIIKLYAQYFYYSCLPVLILFLLGFTISHREIAAAIFPYSFSAWFVTTYLALLLIAPFLQKILLWDEEILKKFTIVSFLLISGVASIHKLTDTYLDTVIWFFFMYIAIGYYKHHLSHKIHINKWLMLVLGGGIYVALVTLSWFGHNGTMVTIGHIASNYLSDYKSIPNLCIAFPVFYFFEHLKIEPNQFINRCAKSALAVYLIHQAPGIIHPLWFDFYQCDIFLSGHYPILYSLFVIISCYAFASIIDILRMKLVEPYFLSIYLFRKSKECLAKFYS